MQRKLLTIALASALSSIGAQARYKRKMQKRKEELGY